MKRLSINTPNELLAVLKNIFPAFEADKYDTSDLTYHEVLRNFAYFYGKNNSRFTERQIKDFAGVVNSAVETGGDLENAFATSLLEHLGQIKSRKPLMSFLSRAARDRLDA